MATAVAVVGTAVAAGSAINQRNQQKKAAREVEQANIQSAEQLARAGAAAEQDIARGADLALEELAGVDAAAGLRPFADTGAFQALEGDILRGETSPAFADLIRNASTQPLNREGVFDLRGPIQNEVARQSNLAASAAAPALRQALLPAAQQQIAATGDIGGIDARMLERQGDIQQAQASQRASALVGANPQLAQLAAGAQEARLLGQVGGQNTAINAANQLARFAGRYT